MTNQKPHKKTIGRAEIISFPELGLEGVPARIDTGAKTSSIWASNVTLKGETLHVTFLGDTADAFIGQEVTFTEFEQAVVASSIGEPQQRYKVRLLVRIKGRKVRAWFTLADRSAQVYPVLIGRNVLMGKFVVDVIKGSALREEEQERSEQLQSRFTQHNPKEDTL